MDFNLTIENDLTKSQVSEITIEKLQKWKSILLKILDSSHKSFQKKEVIFYPNNTNPDRINFACPICGDSVKNTRKRRGNIYLETLTYHCFNGDCLTHMSLDKFFEHFGFYNLLDSGDIYRIKNGQVFDKKTINLDNFLGIKEYLYTRDLLKQKLNFSEIEKDSSLHKYLNSRYQTNLCNFLEEKSTGNLIILNCSPDGNYILSFQIRTMKETTKIENKYLTFTFSKVSELLGFNRDENTNKIDLISTYFGILKIKWDKPINVFEGPLDSNLLPNSIGLCSLNNSFNINIGKIRYIYDYDLVARKKSREILNKGETVFLWGMIEKDLNLPKRNKWDWNDLVIWCLQNKKQIDISKYFSNNKLDIIWI